MKLHEIVEMMEAQDEIAGYAPQWEAPRGLHAVDWDAA